MAKVGYSRLKISPCRCYGSTKTDNLLIAAHNYKYHFGYLGRLEIGDTVMFTDMAAETRYYTVTSVEMLTPADVDKVKDTGDDLILYTCTYGGSKRITVRCSYAQQVILSIRYSGFLKRNCCKAKNAFTTVSF